MNMKRYFALLAVALSITGCTLADKELSSLSTTTTSLRFPYTGGEQSFTVESNLDKWYVYSDEYWFRVTPNTGEKNGTVTVSIGYNEEITERQATISIYNSQVNKRVEIEAKQDASPIVERKMVFIRGGSFTMGSPTSETGRRSWETQHRVTLSDFYLSENQITNEQYCRFLNANKIGSNGQANVTGYGNRELMSMYGNNYSLLRYTNGAWSPYLSDSHNWPVEGVTWFGAKAYCDWAGGRLPTEAEWEYACRAGTTTAFNTGNELTKSQANFGNARPAPVGYFPPNAWGLYDMHGNVWEWCNDWWTEFTSSAVTNPQGSTTGSQRIMRGGSSGSLATSCRSANRESNYPSWSYEGIGFRMASSRAL